MMNMTQRWRTWIPLGAVLLLSAASIALAQPVIPGTRSSQLDPALKGLVLLDELNCAACHTGDPSLKARSKKSPRLAEVGSRLNPGYLEAFISDPHGAKPGTTMPDLLKSLGEQERKVVATSLTHFLLSLKTNDFALQPPDAVAARIGKRLFHSRGCAQCHAPRDDAGAEIPTSASVPLGALEKKYGFKGLVNFLRQPHASRPSGRMPDLRLAGADVERIAHYLLQHTRVPGSLNYTLYRGEVWEGLNSENVTAERAGHVEDFAAASLGKIQHHTALRFEGWVNLPNRGNYTFHLEANGGSLVIDGKPVITQEPSDQRGIKQLQASTELEPGHHAIQLTYFHTGHSPKFSFEMEGPQFARGPIPSAMLSASKEPIAPFEPLQPNPELAARGREHFASLGCANCHDDVRVSPKAFVGFGKLKADQGCLASAAGPWPQFGLSPEQRGWIAQALPQAEHPQLDDRQQVDKTLATFNCIACHERAGLGGIPAERNALFTGSQPGLGDQGRLPPPLTHVGAKLKPEWITEVLLRGKRQRGYLDVSMPQFGEANVGHLVDLFGKVDSLEQARIPAVADAEESKNAGHQLVGATGLSCIACHEFNGQQSGEVGAVDIARVSERLQKNWFHLYLRQPSRFHPTVIMPIYWADGQSPLPNVLGGDASQQIEAIWLYLEAGVRARKPLGLSRQSNELRVGDTTEICRGQSPAGYRGIGVGYPERISLAFDSGEMALRQLWKGEFASVDSGHFRPRGTDLISFPPGIPFHRLESLDNNWPYKGKANHAFPQDHGYQFRGYHLDAARRPTFRYLYGDIAVEDFFEDLRDKAGKPYFKRTLRLETPTEPAPFYFRAAGGKRITTRSNRSFEVDALQLRITSDHAGIVRQGENGDVLIPLTLPKGRSTLTLEYQW
jgi:mono/diheme cytochrome c family protein